jgi:hypothetical protein
MSNARNIANLPNGDDAPIYALRAYALFGESSSSSSGTAPYALKSQNISSFTYRAQGKLRINFSVNMPSTDYLLLTGGIDTDDGGYIRAVMVRDRQVNYVDVNSVYVAPNSGGYYAYEYSIAILF